MSEIIFASSDPKEGYKISKMLQEKKIRKIAPRIYSTNFEETPSVIIKRNIFEILGNLYPDAVLSHRSAFEFKPTATNKLFVTYTYTKKIKLPGITINFLEGKGPVGLWLNPCAIVILFYSNHYPIPQTILPAPILLLH